MGDSKTIYDRVEELEEQVALLIMEMDVIKAVLHDRIAKYETRILREGGEVQSILD